MKLPQATKLFLVRVQAEVFVAASNEDEARYTAHKHRNKIIEGRSYDFEFVVEEFPRAVPGTKILPSSYEAEVLDDEVMLATSVSEASTEANVTILDILQHMQTVDETALAIERAQRKFEFGDP